MGNYKITVGLYLYIFVSALNTLSLWGNKSSKMNSRILRFDLTMNMIMAISGISFHRVQRGPIEIISVFKFN